MQHKITQLPKWAQRFLRAICPEDLYEEIEGDLIQRYNRTAPVRGERMAKRQLMWGVLRFGRPGIILRNTFSYQLINTIMLRNYFTVAFRNMAKSKVFSAINIAGLGVGLAACLLIFQFVSFELTYDTFHDKLDRTYRITNDRFQNGKLIQHGTITYPTIGPTMAKDYPEIEMYSRLMPGGEVMARIGDKSFRGDYCLFVDEHFLSLFSFRMLAGEGKSAMKDAYSMVLTEHVAKKYFDVKGEHYADLVGKTLYWGLDEQPYKITGILADVPENSHLRFDCLVSYGTLIRPDSHDADDSWRWSDFRHYIVLKPGVHPKTLEAKFPAFSDRYFKGDKVSGSVEKFYLQPLKDAHLYSDYEYDIARTASGKAVWAMVIVAVFILVLAWINYINLTTSRALDRAKEVGLRKVMGAVKGQLVRQFIIESLLICFFAFALALVVVRLSQSSFNQIVDNNLSLWTVLQQTDASMIGVLAIILVGGALLSGFYPAFVLSSYQPVTVLKGKFQRSSGGRLLRKALVIFQFTASASLIMGTLVVSRQLSFMNDADLGMNIRNMMTVRAPQVTAWDSTFIQRAENYKHELSQLKGITSVATSSRLPGDRLGRAFNLWLSDQSSSSHVTMSFFGIDYNFFETYQVSLIAGRKFLPKDHHADFGKINTVIINEQAVRLLGIASAPDALGKVIVDGDGAAWTIVGVVNDFHQESLKKPMEPILFFPSYSTYASTSLRLEGVKPQDVLPQVEAIYKKFFPGNAFDYGFLADFYNRQYNDEKRFGKVITIFTALAIIISCLGLVGLSSYTIVQRTKEIGIRKTLGASLGSIITLLSTDFMKLVAVAIVLSIPLAYFAMGDWLMNYPYRIRLQWVLFAVPAVAILFIALITISFQVVKTARTNPADTLKYE